MTNKNNTNYIRLVEEAESAFNNNEYLKAFLIQSCVIESVLKEYALLKLLPIISQSSVFEKSFNGYRSVILADTLFASEKIDSHLYENLNTYRKRRNEVMHKILKFNNIDELNKNIKEAYILGKGMKGFIVDDMNKEITIKEVTSIELQSQINALLFQIQQLEAELKS